MQHRATAILLASLFSVVFVGAASATFITGFEEPTYTSGTVNGQDNWVSTSATPADAVRVMHAAEISLDLALSGLNPAQPVHSGTQALVVSSPLAGSSTVRPVPELNPSSRVMLGVWARPLTPRQSGDTIGHNLGNIFMTMEDTAGIRAAGFRFGFVDDVMTIDYGTSVTGVWQASGVEWAPDTWFHLAMDVNYSSRTYDFLIDGIKVNEDPIPFWDDRSANFNHVRIFRGSGQAGMIVDDLAIIPEPSAILGLVLAGGAMLLRRRRAV